MMNQHHASAGVLVLIALMATPALAQTPLDTLRSTSANSGWFSNVVPDMVPPLPYTEVCFVDGEVRFDIHAVAESTRGGECHPGSPGWIIERDQRSASNWIDAKAQCLLNEMRLPEAFEWGFSCANREAAGLNDMTSEGREWSSNEASPTRNSAESGSPDRVQTITMGKGSCRNNAASRINSGADHHFRCVR